MAKWNERCTCVLVLAGATALAHAGGPAGDAQRIEAGRQVYAAQCASCHGPRGEGQPNWEQPNAAGDLPAPPHGREGHTWKHSDAMLYRIVENGWRDPYNKSRTLTMPAFGGSLSAREIQDVIDYLKTMWTPEQRQFQREESRHAPFPAQPR